MVLPGPDQRPEASFGTYALRVIRLRAPSQVEDLFKPAQPGETARLEVPCRDAPPRGSGIRVELSFGPLADEINLVGRVVDMRHPQDGGPPILIIALGPDQRRRVRYVSDVVAGCREASARGHHRVPVNLEASWITTKRMHHCRIRDLSRGGAFVTSVVVPPIGSALELRVVVPAFESAAAGESKQWILVVGTVSWARPSGDNRGFGVDFKFPHREAAARITRLVRDQENRKMH